MERTDRAPASLEPVEILAVPVPGEVRVAAQADAVARVVAVVPAAKVPQVAVAVAVLVVR